MSAKMVREAIVEALIAEGVEYVFGLPGGQNVFSFTDALYDQKDKIKTVLARDERSAGFMACGYAQITHKPSVCYGTLGPGFGNLLPAMAEAYRGSWPVIFISCSSPTLTAGLGSMQEVPQMDLVKPLVKWSWHLDSPDKVYWMMRRAFTEARSGRMGPIYLELPVEMGVSMVEGEYQKSIKIDNFEPSDEAAASAVELILEAKKPVIFAGYGVNMAEAWTELQEFAELLGIPVVTTSGAKGAIPENHPLAAGVHGHEGSKFTVQYVEDADLVFWIGSAMEDLATDVFTRGRGTGKLICANIDPTHMTKLWAPDVALMGNAKLTLKKLIKIAQGKGTHEPYLELPRVKKLQEDKKSWEKEIEEEVNSDSIPIHPARIAREIDKAKPDNVVLVADAGFNSFWQQGFPYFKLYKPGNSVAQSEYYHIGFAAAAAIGVSMGTKDPVMAVCGDGGFNFVLPELATAVQYKVPVVFFVMDNKSLGWIKFWQECVHDGRCMDTDFNPPIDYAMVAKAASCKSITLKHPEELAAGVKEAFDIAKGGEPVLVHVHTDATAKWWMSDELISVYTEGRIQIPR